MEHLFVTFMKRTTCKGQVSEKPDAEAYLKYRQFFPRKANLLTFWGSVELDITSGLLLVWRD